MLCKLCFFDIGPSPRSGRQHKARGGSEGGTPGQVRSDIKPVKRAAAIGCRPLRGLRISLLSFTWGLRPMCARIRLDDSANPPNGSWGIVKVQPTKAWSAPESPQRQLGD